MDRFGNLRGVAAIVMSLAMLGVAFESLFFLPLPAGTVWEIPSGAKWGRMGVFVIVSLPFLGLIGFSLKHFFGRENVFSFLFDFWEKKRGV